MNIIGKKSLLFYFRIPISIYSIGFIISNVWIFTLMILFIFTKSENDYISKSYWKTTNNNGMQSAEIIQFHYPFTKMVVAVENTSESFLLGFLGLFSFCFILFFATKLVFLLSSDKIFNSKVVKNIKFLGVGLFFFGLNIFLIDITDGFKFYKKNYDLTPPFMYILVGLILFFIKEIFKKAHQLQQENDLTI